MSAGGTGPEPERFFFLHLQKTGGTSVFLRFPRVFGQEGLYPNESDGDVVTIAPQLSVDRLVERWEQRRAEIRIVSGHFPLCTTELLGVPFRSFTVLREPVDRTLSYLRHHRLYHADDADRPLEELYEDPFRYDAMVHNHMVKMLGLETSEMTDGMLTVVEFGDDRLARAKDALAGLELFGFQDRFAEFWSAVEARFGWDLNTVAHANRTVTVEVPESFRRRIAEDNSQDMELYEFALELAARS